MFEIRYILQSRLSKKYLLKYNELYMEMKLQSQSNSRSTGLAKNCQHISKIFVGSRINFLDPTSNFVSRVHKKAHKISTFLRDFYKIL